MSLAEKREKENLIHFGGVTLDLERRGLYRGQQRIHLTSKPLETLIFLVHNRGRVVEKQELLDAVWKDTFVTEDTLVHAIREIRRALEDDKENPRFVQTVPRQGYRFVCEVSEGDLPPASAPIGQESAPQPDLLAGHERRIPRWLWIAAPLLAIIPVLAWVFWPRGEAGKTVPAATEPRAGRINKQITIGEFFSGKPAFSPDGKFILYVSSSEETRGYGDLFIRQYPEGTPLRITNRMNPSGDLPIFTADGSHVVFSVPRLDQAGVRHHDLWKVPSFGGPPERLIEDASGAGFSPDENWAAYTKHLPSGNALWLSAIRALEEHLEVSATGYAPRWSPDGEWLAYTTSDPNGGKGDIWICKVSWSDGGRPAVSDQKQITREHEQIYGLSWTADSRSIIFASKRTGPSQLYKVSIAEGSITPLLGGVGEYSAPSASPDGKAVIFYHYRLVIDLKMTALGANCEAKNMTYGEFHSWPRISPAEERLASVTRQIDNTERLTLTDLKTKESSQLSNRDARHPCWLDEENVAFLSPDASMQNTEVLVTNISTRETRRLTLFSGEACWLAIHPDRNRVAVALKSPDARERILLRNLTGGADETLHEGSEYEYLRWSPDGSALCWNKPGPSRNAPYLSGGVWMMVLSRAEPQLVADGGYCPVWSKDGAAIYFGMRQGQQGLWRYDLRQKKAHLVCSWDSVFSYDVVGNRLVFGQHKNDGQIYSMSLDQ
ncbi:MAG TPA: winged helix-turn-helix domain-containing protein [Blastocatellia bacterium]|nr:winged helix-turn-helix domain-containing protein [Blastocatellia bacterium]